MTTEQLDYREALLVPIARGLDSPDGYYAFYELVFGHEPPWHVRWMIQAIYDGKSEDKGTLIWAFRGSWKTTSISILFTAFRIGHNPTRSNLIIGANDDAANLVTSSIADIIEYNPAWKKVFPHVKPDKLAGWGENGYEVYCDKEFVEADGYQEFRHITYEEWTAKIVAKKDATLLGLGYRSNSVNGKHPDGCLIVDDLHNEENTKSARERAHALKVVQDTLFPTMVEDPTLPPGQQLVTWNVFVGTPWTDDDVYHFIKNTGEFHFVNVPAMRPLLAGESIPEGATVEFFADGDLQGQWVMSWTERFGKETALRWFNKVGKRGFWRMFLLDLTGANEFGIRYYSYPHEEIPKDAPVVGGVDYASILYEFQRNDKNRSYFAMYYGAKLPTGGIVIVDGVVQRVMQSEAERIMEAAQNLFPGYLYTVFEADGKGEEALQTFLRRPDLQILPVKTGGRGKARRIEGELEPWLANGTIRISDEDTPALAMLRKALEDYPSSIMDPLDAVYWVMKGAEDALLTSGSLNEPVETPSEKRRKRYKGDTENPYVSLGRR